MTDSTAQAPKSLRPWPYTKELSDVLSPVLSALFNQSVAAGEISLKWKHALVAPVYKKEDKHLASNYRPVSLKGSMTWWHGQNYAYSFKYQLQT